MKYTILGFQQTKLIESKLDVVDALVLRVIKDMYSSASMEFITKDGTRYMWINYSYFIEQIPIIGSKRNLMRRIDKYSTDVLLLRILKHERNGQKGNYAYIAPTLKLDSLQDYDPYDKMSQGLGQNDTRVVTKCHNKDTSIRDTSIKDTRDSSSSNFSKIIQVFQNNGFGLINSTTKDILTDLIEDYSSEWVLEALEMSVIANVRKINYATGILKKWKAEGKDTDKPKMDPYAGIEEF